MRLSMPRITDVTTAIAVKPAITSQELWNALIKTSGFCVHCVYAGKTDPLNPAQKQHAPDGDSHGVRDVRRRQGYSVYRSDMSGFHRAKNRAEVGRLENRGRRHVPCSGI
jgi:hypothetical protein